jgi:hypothetical protein
MVGTGAPFLKLYHRSKRCCGTFGLFGGQGVRQVQADPEIMSLLSVFEEIR